MRFRVRLLSLFVVAFMVVGLVTAACAKTPPSTKNKDVLIYATPNQVPSLDPAMSSNMAMQRLVDLLYDGLVKLAPDSLNIVPAVADHWEVSPDAKVWKFFLKKDIKFTDGTPVNAEAVKFSFDRMMKVNLTPAGAFAGVLKDNTIKVVDDYTVEFDLDDPLPPFLSMIASTGASIVNPKLQEHYEGDDLGQKYLTDHAMGSGRYTVQSFTPNGDAVFARNDKWYGQESAIKTFIARIVPDASTGRMLLEKGEVDMLEGRFLDWDTIEELRKADGVKIVESPSMDILRLIFNNEAKPFDDPRVRQAFSMAVDYDSIIKDIYQGNADRLLGGIPKGMMGYDPNAKVYNQNLDEAKKLLTEAGYPDGFTTELSMGSTALWQKITTKVQADVARVGIKLDLREYALPALYEKMSSGKFTLGMSGWTPDYADPDSLVWYFFYSKSAGPGYNWAFYQNKQVDDLILEARKISDQAQREQMYKQITQITNEAAAYCPIAQAYGATPVRSNVQGYVVNPMSIWALPLELMSKQ